MDEQVQDNVMILVPRDRSREVLLVSTNHQAWLFEINQPLDTDYFFSHIVDYMEKRNGYATFKEAEAEILQYCHPLDIDEQTLRSVLIDAMFQMFHTTVEGV